MTFMSPAAPLWGQAFRPLFLLAAGFSSLALALWGLALQGQQLSIMELGTFWHSHEMLFGFAAAVIAGFLLTAVQNWTGRRATNGLPLLILTLVWLAGRVLMLFAPLVPWWLTALVDLAFLPLVAWFFWQLLYAVRQQRNYFFVPVLVLMTAVNAAMHWGNAHHNMGLVLWGSHAVSLMVVLLITIVGGRVMPMFTANGTMTPKVEAIPWLEKSVLGGTWLVVAVFLTTLDQYLPAPVLAAVLIVVALAQALRVARWRIQVTWKVPLLWSLHLAYWCVPLGLLLLALHYLGLPITFSTALHALTAGAIGGMILAMIARVSLGHSGRRLEPHPLIAAGFALLLAAALVRTLAVILWPAQTTVFYSVSALLWVLAFAIFVALYARILTTPRPDGRPG